LRWAPHVHDRLAVQSAANNLYFRVLNIDVIPELAGPFSRGELSGGVARLPSGICEYRDLLETYFQFSGLTLHKSAHRVCIDNT
jgi:hypothetical protein